MVSERIDTVERISPLDAPPVAPLYGPVERAPVIETFEAWSACEYFTRYGNNLVPGACAKFATLQMVDNGTPPIRVCHMHANVIVGRFPMLGDLEQRFTSIRGTP